MIGEALYVEAAKEALDILGFKVLSYGQMSFAAAGIFVMGCLAGIAGAYLYNSKPKKHVDKNSDKL